MSQQDDVGNPLSYYNGYSYTFTWTQGRRLATAVRGSNTLSFEYNDEGIRTSKTVNGITHYYQLAGGQILSENWTDESGIYHVVIFIYDENGSPIGMSYSNSTYSYNNADNYLFVKNMQGDIVHICDEAGNIVVSYEYDAWGTVTSYSGSNTTAYKINPFRYRGYFYDVELGLYYLNSRYYDPSTGRFLNADGYVSTGTGLLGYNMFAYCNNSPIIFLDHCGSSPNEAVIKWGSSMWWLCAADGAIPIGELVYGLGFVVTLAITWVSAENATDAVHTIPKPNIKTNDASKAKEKEKSDALPNTQSSYRIYFHATTYENAVSIMEGNLLYGSVWESGYVYAWKLPPSRFAISHSGARGNVLISFETNAPFITDTGISSRRVLSYLPVVSLFPGPIRVRNVKILGDKL